MRKLSESFFLVGVFFVLGGAFSVVGGALSMFRFLGRPDTGDDVLAGEIVRGMILPHIFMFLGMGVISYGVILIAKGVIISRRKAE